MKADIVQQFDTLFVNEFRHRFPLFHKIDGEFGDCRERIPWYFGFLIAAAHSDRPGGHCFVLDSSPGTSAIVAVLAALNRLQSDFASLVEDYARFSFKRGQRVRVLPSDAVFEYEGLWPEFPGQFKLKLLSGGSGFRSFPLVDILRLEPTDRLKPRGTGATNLGQRASGPLDRLLGLSSCGNNSIIRNVVLCNMPRSQFARTVDAVALAPAGDTHSAEKLSRFLPWGSIGADGTLRANDAYQTVGEPLIAVSGVPGDVACNCSAALPNTKVVFADGPQRLARDLQAYDHIVERQKLVILASSAEEDDLQVLRDRGCTIWRMSGQEILLGEDAPQSRSRKSLVGATVRAADIRQRTLLRVIECHDNAFEKIAGALEAASSSFDETDQSIELDEALKRLFVVLFECSESCSRPADTMLQSIESARALINKNSRWLEPERAAALKDAITGLISVIEDSSDRPKAAALIELLTERVQKGESWAVVGRSPRTCARLADNLRDHGLHLDVAPISSISFQNEYDGIVLAGWPNESRFRRLLDQQAAPDIRILLYQFEKPWFDRYLLRAKQRDQIDTLTAAQRAEILQMSTSQFYGADQPVPVVADSPSARVQDFPVFQFEARVARRRLGIVVPPSDGHDLRSTRLVRFAGGCHAFLTEWAQWPVLNDMIERGGTAGAKIGRKTVETLLPGDFLLFRAAGDKEFIRLIAEDRMGTEEYGRKRKLAERWKMALQALGSSPAIVQRRLADFDLDRTSVTVGSWLGDPEKIGPGTDADIKIIATAARDTSLLATLNEVADAISTIRSAHLSAGMRLSKLIYDELQGRIHDIGDEPTLLDLGYGDAWVVRVETVEDEEVSCTASKTNRLLWEADTEF
jgi:hypothetical protein